jgi:hypothetical protein
MGITSGLACGKRGRRQEDNHDDEILESLEPGEKLLSIFTKICITLHSAEPLALKEWLNVTYYSQ